MEIKSLCSYNSRSGMVTVSTASSSPPSPEPWQTEKETTAGEETVRAVHSLRCWATALTASHPLSLTDLLLLLNYLPSCKILSNLQKARFPPSSSLFSYQLYLVYLVSLGVRRLHQRIHLARLFWMYKGYVGTLVLAQFVSLSTGSKTWASQDIVNPQNPSFVMKRRAISPSSVSSRLKPLCGILDHHFHGREDPLGLLRMYTFILHLLVASLVRLTAPITLQPSSHPKTRSMPYLLVSHRMYNMCGILDHHFHGNSRTIITVLITVCLSILALASFVNLSSPELLKYLGALVLTSKYRDSDYGPRVPYTNKHLSTFLANYFKHHPLKKTTSNTSTTFRDCAPRTPAMALPLLVLLTLVSSLAWFFLPTAQCLLTVTYLPSLDSIDDVQSCNLDQECLQLLFNTFS